MSFVKRDGEKVFVTDTGPMGHRQALDLAMDLLTAMDAAKTAGEVARGEFEIPEKQCPACEEFKPIATDWSTNKAGTPVAYCKPCMSVYRAKKDKERKARKAGASAV